MSVNITLFRDLAQEHWASIEVYADRLADGLRRLHVPGWIFTDRRPRGIEFERLTVPLLYFNRSLLYPPFARRWQGDINHILDNSYGHLVHFLDRRRTIVTSHGGTPQTWRAWNREGPAMRFFDWTFAGTLKAAHIVIVSEYSKREIVQHFAYDPARIHVVYHGVDERYRPLPDDVRQSTQARFLQPVEAGLILHVGHCAERKNVEGLLRAFAVLLKQSTRPYRLLQVGGRFPPEQTQLIGQLGLAEHVTQLPLIANSQLVELYNAADLFVFPSLYEGFGIPLIEAMACGAPIVCTDYELFHEVCGPAAQFAVSDNPALLAEAMATVLNDTALSAALCQRGLERARLFTWQRTARQTLAVYQQLYEETHG